MTPKEAADRLAEILAAAPTVTPVGPRFRPTFGEACEEWLRYVEHDRARTDSTMRDYRNTVRRYLLPYTDSAKPSLAHI